ncbi:MAG: AAA family ATPase [Candidatus Saccharibacteria bacterium]|nr:AAA family ATPase [Candidatus Saccharibacteria bacterium]
MRQTKLIVLRGPSGSGKTTTSKILFDSARHRTALIEQDYYRFIFNPPGGGEKPNSDTIHKMIRNDVLTALNDGYDVILEGILSVKAYGEVLEDIFANHSGENYIFYFDVSFEETVKRHKHRQKVALQNKGNNKLVQDEKRGIRLQEFGKKEMREWYSIAHRSNHRLEKIIPEYFSIKDSVNKILFDTGL